MTVKISKPSLNLREELAKINSSEADKALVDGALTVKSAKVYGAVTSDSLRVEGDVVFTDDLGLTPKVTWDSTAEDLSFGDNVKATFGAGDDLQIFSNGTTSYIKETGSGNLEIRATDTYIKSADNAKISAVFDTDGPFKAYYDGASKLATTSTGIDVTGTVTADGLVVDTTADNGAVITAYDNATTTYPLKVQNSAGTGRLEIGTYGINNNIDLKLQTQDKTRLEIDGSTGDISFMEDTGTTAKFFWDASAESLGIGTNSPVGALDVRKDGTSQQLQIWRSDLGVNDRNLNITSPTSDSVTEPFRFQTGNALAFRVDATDALLIDSTGKVGIGATSIDANSNLQVQNDSGNSLLRMRAGASSLAGIDFGDSSDIDIGGLRYNNASNYMQLNVNAAERMRIDSSGNVLVGTTSTTPYAFTSGGGVVFKPNDASSIARSGANAVLILNKSDSDGDVLSFRKSGATVGSIGVDGGDNIYFAGGSGSTKGIYINQVAVYPADTGGAPIDNAVALGQSTSRFKDLYLSGGVYLGGTGAANKLDDYEEGTWTPVVGGGLTSISVSSATYTKVGRLITLHLNGSIHGDGSSDQVKISGLPYSHAGGNAGRGNATPWLDHLNIGASLVPVVAIWAGYTTMFFYAYRTNSNSNQISITGAGVNSSELQLNITYYAN